MSGKKGGMMPKIQFALNRQEYFVVLRIKEVEK